MLSSSIFEMNYLDRYTTEICSKLKQIAEGRDWKNWRELKPEDIRVEIELTYHLHAAADAVGTRSGMPPMPPCPLRLPLEHPDPATFLETYSSQLNAPRSRRNAIDQAGKQLSCN